MGSPVGEVSTPLARIASRTRAWASFTMEGFSTTIAR